MELVGQDVPTTRHAESRAWRLSRLGALLIGGVLTFMIFFDRITGPRAGIATDWIAFDNAADRLWSGETIYRALDTETEPLPYLYPPFTLWLATPLALFGFVMSWVVSMLAMAVALVVGFAKMLGSGVGHHRGAALAIALSTGSVASSVLIGQYSGLYVLAVGCAVAAWKEDREGLAGVFLALLWIKPNLAVAVFVVLAWGRAWTALRSFTATAGALVGSSLLLGIELWAGFFENAERMVELQREGLVPIDKMVTLQATLQETSGLSGSAPLLWAVWAVCVGLAGLATLSMWAPLMREQSIERSFAVLLCFMVGANPRLYFYDGVLVVAAGLLLVAAREFVVGDRSKKLLAVFFGVLWIGSWGAVWRELNLVVGPLALTICLVVAVNARQASVRNADHVEPTLAVGELPQAA